ETDMPDFRFTLADFRATYVQPGESGKVGERRSFEADIQVTTPGEEQETRTLQGNKPLHVKGATMVLLGNGYAPEIRMRDSEATVWAEVRLISVQVREYGYTWHVVLKATDARREQLTVVGFCSSSGTIGD